MDELNRITHNPAVMQGKASIRGMRITVATIVGLMGTGVSIEEILDAYPYLEREDVLQALKYAALCARSSELVLITESR